MRTLHCYPCFTCNWYQTNLLTNWVELAWASALTWLARNTDVDYFTVTLLDFKIVRGMSAAPSTHDTREGFGKHAWVHAAEIHLASFFIIIIFFNDLRWQTSNARQLVTASLKCLTVNTGLARRTQHFVFTSRSWTHKHSCTSGSVQGKQPQQTLHYNTQNTVLAASAHVLPFFFFCLSLIVDVLLQSSVEFVCFGWNVALVTAQDPLRLPCWTYCKESCDSEGNVILLYIAVNSKSSGFPHIFISAINCNYDRDRQHNRNSCENTVGRPRSFQSVYFHV